MIAFAMTSALTKDIRKRMIDVDLTETALAIHLGCTRQMVDRVIRGLATTPWIRRGIAAKLGMTYLGMWGDEDPGTQRGERARPDPSRGLIALSIHGDSTPRPA